MSALCFYAPVIQTDPTRTVPLVHVGPQLAELNHRKAYSLTHQAVS